MNPGFWKDKSVFLTGHTGFKGGWLSLWLQQLGARITGYALDPPSDPSLFAVAKAGQGMESIIADVRDLEKLKSAIACVKPQIVIHMAAQSLVRHSYEAPVETYATNVMGTVNLLEAVRGCDSVRSVVCVTSDKCYENKEWVWGYREDEAMGGYDPYSNSKGCSELVVSAYRSSFFNALAYEQHHVGVASGRAGNVIGGGDWAENRLVPDLMRAFSEGKKPVIRNPMAIRPWQHVLEPLAGYMLLAEKLHNEGPKFAEGWNFGPDDGDVRSVQYIADHLAKGWGKGTSWVLDKGAHPHEARTLRLDCAKAKARLGWEPVWDLDTTLEKILSWHKAFAEKKDMREVCLEQIASYQNLASTCEKERARA